MSTGLTRFVLLRCLGLIWTVTFAIWWSQFPLLVGERGLTPLTLYLQRVGELYRDEALIRLPTVFWLDPSDRAMWAVGLVGTVLGVAVALGVTNALVQAVLWILYVSVVNAGQDWYGYGWEMLMCEVSFLSIFLCPLRTLGPRGLVSPGPVPILLFRWLTFRLLIGAGLIKWRGDDCWRELTCLVWHYETQPNPHPVSWMFHHLPVWAHQIGAAFNHLVELVLPWFVFGPRWPRRMAGAAMVLFQLVLIASGNLAFFNWLALFLGLAVLDDEVWERLFPRLRGWLGEGPETSRQWRRARQLALGAVLLLVAWRSVPVVDNLFFAEHQAMNRGFDPLHLVNTYGAFGSVGDTREEAVIQGTADDPEHPDATWIDYEFACKPGDPGRRPCVVTPWHPHLEWQLWFVPLQGLKQQPWLVHLVAKFLENDPLARAALLVDPFPAAPPRAVRVARFRYAFTDWGEPGWWRREARGLYVRALTRDDAGLRRAMREEGWE